MDGVAFAFFLIGVFSCFFSVIYVIFVKMEDKKHKHWMLVAALLFIGGLVSFYYSIARDNYVKAHIEYSVVCILDGKSTTAVPWHKGFSPYMNGGGKYQSGGYYTTAIGSYTPRPGEFCRSYYRILED